MKTIKLLTAFFLNLLILASILISACDEISNSTEPDPPHQNQCPNGNNTFDCADLITIGIPKQEKIESCGDVDFFKFTTSQAGVIEIAIDPVPSNIDMDVFIFNGNQQQIAYSTHTALGQSVFFYLLKDAGTYFIECYDGYGDASSETPYSVLVNLDVSDVYELNNQFSSSKIISLNSNIQAKLKPWGDIDVFKFNIPRDGIIQIAIDPVPPNIDMDFELYDSQQNFITKKTNTANGQSTYMNILRKAGIYFISLYDGWLDNWDNQFYTLNITLDTSDIYEMNNTFSESKLITLNENINGKIRPVGDYDFYKFTVQNSGVIYISVNPVPPNIDMDVILYDPQQNQIAYSTNTSSGQSVYFSFNIPYAGTYYLLLHDGWDDNENTSFYTLKVIK